MQVMLALSHNGIMYRMKTGRPNKDCTYFINRLYEYAIDKHDFKSDCLQNNYGSLSN